MELKVWVEGIQRVICGVGEQTTCQDVVIALANATGKTGRFTLVERWRDNERLLSPSDSPLQVLHKWGEYSMDVQFILRHSDGRLKVAKKTRRTDKFSNNFSPHNGNAVKKSLTFSGGHSYSIFPPKTSRPALIRRSGNENSSLESLEDQHSVTSQSSRSTLSPYASFEGRPKAGTIQGFPSRSPYGSFEKKHWAPSPRSSSSNSTPVGSIERRTVKTTPGAPLSKSQSESHNQRKSPTSASGPPKPVEEYDLNKNIAGRKTVQQSVDRTISDRCLPEKTATVNGQNVAHVKPTSKTLPTTATSQSSKASASSATAPSSSSSSSPSKEELLKLMSIQVEKLNAQDSRLNVLDSEITVLDGREQEHSRLESSVKTELQRLQASDQEQSGELEGLELVSWEDKLAIEGRQGQKLQAEHTQLKSKLGKCESELLSHRKKCQETEEALKSERGRQQQDRKERELKALQDMSDLQKQINQQLVQHDKNQSSIESLQTEVKTLESSILERKTKLADLQTDLKDANLGRFSQVPNMALRPSPTPEGKPQFSRSSSARPGGARKMLHSPSLLKETVATDRNPHGLWV